MFNILAQAHGFRFFESGKDYVYQFETGLGVGTGGVDDQPAMSGASFRGVAKFQAEEDLVKIQLYSSSLRPQSFFNGPYEQGYSPFEEREQRTEFELHDEEQISDYSFSVNYVDGKVQEITLPDEAPVWVKNIMRAFASSFQIDLPNVESEKFWNSQEVTLKLHSSAL